MLLDVATIALTAAAVFLGAKVVEFGLGRARGIAFYATSRERLVEQLGALLGRADDLDRAGRILSNAIEPEWHQELGKVSQRIAELTEAATKMEVYVEKRDVRSLRRDLVRAWNLAAQLKKRLVKLERRLSAVEADARKDAK